MGLVYQDGKFLIIYISSYGSFVLTGQYVGLNTAKTNTLRCATSVINTNFNMIGYFDFFVSFADKNSCFEINTDEFWWKCQHI